MSLIPSPALSAAPFLRLPEWLTGLVIDALHPNQLTTHRLRTQTLRWISWDGQLRSEADYPTKNIGQNIYAFQSPDLPNLIGFGSRASIERGAVLFIGQEIFTQLAAAWLIEQDCVIHTPKGKLFADFCTPKK